MRARRILAVAKKEFIHIIRDPRSLGMAIAIPMLMLLLFGYALTLDVDNVPLAVWDQDNTPYSREYISYFCGSPYFSMKKRIANYSQLEESINKGEVLAGLVIPVGFGGKIHAGQSAFAQLIIDGSDSNTATIALGYAEAINGIFSRKVALKISYNSRWVDVAEPIKIVPRVWYNQELKSRNYIIPGLIAVIMMVIAALLTSLTVAKEWENGSMEQLISTPIKVEEFMIGKILPYFAIAMLDVLLAVVLGKFLFKVPLRGNIALLFFMASIFLTGALFLGLLISIATKNQLLANQVALITTFLPSFLLSGFMYSIDNMPKALQIITHVIPARYFISLLKGIYLKGVGLKILYGDALLLGLFAALVILAAKVKLKKKLV